MARGKAKILKFRNFYEFRMCEQKTGIEIVANPRYQRSLLEKCHILLKTDIFEILENVLFFVIFGAQYLRY